MIQILKSIFVGLCALVILSGCAANYTSERAHPDYVNNKVDIERIAIVPPIVEYNSLEFSGENVPIPEREEEMKQIIVDFAAEELRARGYEPVVVKREEVEAELDNYNIDLGKLREQYSQIRDVLYEKSVVKIEDSVKFEQSVGEAAAIVASYSDADAVLLMRYYAYEKTSGAIAKDVAVSVLVAALTGGVGVQPTSGEAVEVAVLDGISGNVLWTNHASLPSVEAASLKHAMQNLKHDIDDIETNGPEHVGIPAAPETDVDTSAAILPENEVKVGS
ncbi:hypothetical protein [Echinimonas agarilytica]|uniref:Lipoprotein n=1 Tax=Echinimonas agarilytica TaxID=1215918 RepID=A0AA42B7X4_9GAMM|nr:hypothetical protein [Echinimonas agarilytica]MCM2679706.1 hypothetical protein [Echinimonas agarilytica]